MSETTEILMGIADGSGPRHGIPSFCSSNKYVIKAVLEYAKNHDEWALIESTANQVNQYGGYTGMTPEDFKTFIYQIADDTGLDHNRIILGGDHLGPLTFRHLPEAQAMKEAEALIKAYVSAGFKKIHIDTSMRLKDDAVNKPLLDAVIAERCARLCSVAEKAFEDVFGSDSDIVYIIGSEVPIPGGAQSETETLHVTSANDFNKTLQAFKTAFEKRAILDVFSRVIGMVVQPGAEFGDNTVDEYNREAAMDLTKALKKHTGLVFEGHSTDYQTKLRLREMAQDGIRILKVGPELTFALREGLFAVDLMIGAIKSDYIGFADTLESVMLSKPDNWEKYFTGTVEELRVKRKYSFSDRWRYYANEPLIEKQITDMMEMYNQCSVPMNILSQFMPEQYLRVREGKLVNRAEDLVKDKIKEVLQKYYLAARRI